MENELDIKRKKTKVVIVIPTLNEEKSVGIVIDKIRFALQKYNFEIIIVDGNSSDKTVEVAIKHKAKVIIQKKDGYGNALFAGYLYGIEELDCDILVTIDADDTYDPTDCTKIIDSILTNKADYIIGKRVLTKDSMSKSHKFGNKLISYLIRKLLYINVSDTQSGLFAFRSYLIKHIDFFNPKGWEFNTELLTRAAESGMNIGEVNISYSERKGETNLHTYNAGITNLIIILRMMRDSEPLRLLGVIGAILIGIGLIFGSIVLYDFFILGTVIKPTTALLAALLVITGVQIFSLGLVADMIKRRQQKRFHLSHNYYEKHNK